MLAGLQSATETLFPAIRDIAPSEDEFALGEQKASAGRVIRISAYKTEVFDMHDAKSRTAYNKRMLDLSQRVQVGSVRILAHDRCVMSRTDGSTGWFGYLEWMEYSRDDGGADRRGAGGKGRDGGDHVAT